MKANKKLSSSKMVEEDSMPENEVSKEFTSFLVDELKETYWAEKHFTRVLPKMQKGATIAGLKEAFAGFMADSEKQVERLEQIFELLCETPRLKKNEAMAALVEEANDVIEETGKGTYLRDEGLATTAQKMKNYEITTYSELVRLARTMGNEDIISLLEETLSEEKEGEELLTALLEGNIKNPVSAADREGPGENVDKVTAVYDSVNLTGKNVKKA